MEKITFAIMGMGNRGTAYAAKALKYPQEMEIAAMADTRRVRLDAARHDKCLVGIALRLLHRHATIKV